MDLAYPCVSYAVEADSVDLVFSPGCLPVYCVTYAERLDPYFGQQTWVTANGWAVS